MAKDVREQDLIDMLEYMGQGLVECEKAINNLYRQPTELKKKVWLTERAQIVHERMHRICGIAAQPPINDLARNQIHPENARLKKINKFYRDQLMRLGGELHPDDY